MIAPVLFMFAALYIAQVHAEEPLRIVATGGRIGVYPYGTGNPDKTAFWHRTPHQLGGPVDEMQLGFMNWMLSYSSETENSNDVTIDYAWLVRESDGQVVPLTFNGERDFTMPASSEEPFWPADPVDSSVWTGGKPQKDEVFWLHIKGHVPSEGRVAQGCPVGYSGARFIMYDPANGPGTKDFAGSVPSISGQSARTRGLPVVFLGRYTEPGHLAVIGIGDSILDGSGDGSSSYGTIGGFGFFNRAATDEDGKNAIAMFNLTRHGATAGGWQKSGNVRQPHFLKYANVVVEEYGTNDLGSSGGGNVETIKNRLQYIWTQCRDAGVEKIVRTQLMPRTSSTDQWATKENQTPNNNWGADGSRDELNAFFEAKLADGTLDVVLPTLSVIADPTADYVWLTDGEPKHVTSDGTHLNKNGNAMLAPVLREELLALKVENVALDYNAWTETIAWGAADSSPAADPNHDGISNELAYALDIPPLGPVAPSARPSVMVDTASADGPWFKFTYRQNALASDILYEVLSTTDLNGLWTALSPDGVNIIEQILDADPDGDGSAKLVQVCVKPTGETSRFLRLRATQ